MLNRLNKLNGHLIRSRAPLRISLAGGGTDVSPYPETEGGAVLSTTIDSYAYCTLTPIKKKVIEVRSDDYNILQIYRGLSDMKYDGKLDLIKAGFKTLGLAKRGFRITLSADSPPGSGLGSSSAIAVAFVGCMLQNSHQVMTHYEISKTAYDVERVELGIKGGKQDQYASTFGGFNFIEFKKDSVIVNPLRVRNEIIHELLASSVLCDTGVRRLSGKILNRQIKNYEKKDSQIIEHLRQIKDLTYNMKDSLVKGDIMSMAKILHQSWIHKKNLDKSISNKHIDKIYSDALNNGALGGKLLGAGGGGHLLFICDPLNKLKLSKVLQKSGCNIVKFNFDKSGLQTWKVNDMKVFI